MSSAAAMVAVVATLLMGANPASATDLIPVPSDTPAMESATSAPAEVPTDPGGSSAENPDAGATTPSPEPVVPAPAPAPEPSAPTGASDAPTVPEPSPENAQAPPVEMLAPQGIQAQADGAVPVVSVSKTLVAPGPFNPGQEFQYQIKYTCSSLTAACPNATLTDAIPSQLQFVTNTATGDPSTITFENGVLKVVFLTPLVGGGIGLPAGSTGQLLVSVKFPAGTPDGTSANNCAVMTADGAAMQESCATAVAQTTPAYGVSLDKKYVQPFTGETVTSGVQGTGPTTTLDLTAALGGNQGASSMTVTDPDPNLVANNNPFDSFDLTDFKTLSLPTGIQAQIQVRSTGGYSTAGTYVNGNTPALPGASGIDAADVTGISVVYSCTSPAPGGSVCVDGKIPVGTSLGVKAGVQLRDALRSNPAQPVAAGTIHNQAIVTAKYPEQPDQTATDTADYTVIAQTPGVTGAKTISPASAQQQSGADVTMSVRGTNNGNIPGTGMTVTDPDPSSSATPFDHFTFKSFNALALPSGVTAEVNVLVGGSWVPLDGTFTNGQTPSLGSVAAADVKGVQYVYTGNIAPGASITNSFVTTLKDGVPAGPLNPANCAAVSMTTDAGSAGLFQACANFTVTAISQSITADKSFSPTSGVAHTDPRTTVTLTGRNTSNVPITNFVMVDPGTGSGGGSNLSTFDAFDFTEFGALTAPSGTTWKVEVFNGTSWLNVGTYANGTTPPNADLPIAAGSVQGVRYTLASGSIPANTNALSTKVGLELRDTLRSTGASIDSGTVHNCVTAGSTGITDATKCANYTINAVSPGTGVGVDKNIVKSSVVQGSGDTTNVVLTGKNGANVPVNTLILEDTSPAFWNSFEFDGFGTTSRPAGTTSLLVEYSNGTSWQTVGTYPGTGNVTPALPGGVTNDMVKGLRYTWTGSLAANQTVTANFSVELKDSATAGIVENCVDQSYSSSYFPGTIEKNDCDTITITSQTRTVEQKKSFSPNTGTIGQDPATTATLSVRNTSNVPLDSIVVTDPAGGTTPFDEFDLTGFGPVTLPSNVQVTIEANDGAWKTVGTYTNGQTVTVPGAITPADVTAVRLTFSGTGSNRIPAAQQNMMSVGVKLALRDTVRGTATPVDTTAIQNCFATTTIPADAALTGDPCAVYTPQASSPGVAVAKSWSPGSGARDELPESTITIKGRNSGNVPVDALVLQDPAFVGTAPDVAVTAFEYFDVTGFTGLVLPQGANQVRIDVLTADGAWHNGTAAATLPAGSAVNGVDWADIVGVRATFSDSSGTKLPVVANPAQTGNVGIQVQLRETLRSTGAPIEVPPAGSIEVLNESNALVVFNGQPGTPENANAKYTITSGAVKVTPDKTLYPAGMPEMVNPNQTLVYQLQITNAGTRNLVAPVVLDKFDPSQLGYDPAQPYPMGGWEFVAGGSSLTGTGLTVDDSVPGQVRFTFAEGDSLAPGQTAYIRLALTTKPGLPAGTQITNTYGVSWDVEINGAGTCTSGGDSGFDGAGNGTWCTDSQKVEVKTANSMASLKQIKGDDIPFTNVANPGEPCPVADGYTYYPCIAHTHTGGVFDYKLNVTVSGNVPIKQARAIDVLPHIGDTGVILTGQSRDSEWTPTMYSNVSVTGLPADASYTLYYSTSTTPCTTPLSNDGGAWCSDWSSTAPANLATVKSIAISVTTADGSPLQPASTFTLHWQMLAPAVAADKAGAITWNSFAFSGEPTDGSGWLRPAEPRKVGIDLSNPTVTVEKTSVGGDGEFSFTLTGEGEDGQTATVATQGGEGSHTWGPTGVMPGKTYTLTETPTPGWTSHFEQCTNGEDPITPISSTAGSVTFVAAPGAEISCAFTNTKMPGVTVNKTATGASGVFSFTLTPIDPAGDPITKPLTVENGSASVSWGPDGLAPGEYTLTEKVEGDWVSNFVTCVNGEEPIGSNLTDGRVGVSFTLKAGDDVSCSFLNVKRPGITVAKTAFGGAGDFEFTLTPTAPATGGGAADVAVSDGGSALYTWGPQGLTPGGTYTLAETAKPGWISTFEQCTGAENVKAGEDGSVTFTAPAGSAVLCSFANVKQPQITVEKTTVGDGSGTFPFVLEGTGGSAKDVVVTEGSGSASWGPKGLEPGEYTLWEDTSGDIEKEWVSTFESCEGTEDATLNEDGSVTFTAAAGADISCSFTNAKRPTVEIEKTSAGGDGTFAFALLSGDEEDGDVVEVTTVDGSGGHLWGPEGLVPGGTYTLAETVEDGWISTFESCTGTEPTGWTDSSVTFVAEAGADISCSFTNTKRPTIEIEKTTVGGDSGTFPFVLEGPGGSTEDVVVAEGSGSASWGPEGLEPGEYTLWEDTSGDIEKNWLSTFESCTGAEDATLNEDGSVTFTAEPGAEISCAFTNEKRPTIKIEKTAVGGDGTFAFTLQGDDEDGSAAEVTTVDGSGAHLWGPDGLVPSKSYTLSETPRDGWTSSFESCTGVEPTGSTATSVTFTAEAGAEISCSFTNTKVVPPATPPLQRTGADPIGGAGPFVSLLLLGGGLLLLAARRRRLQSPRHGRGAN